MGLWPERLERAAARVKTGAETALNGLWSHKPHALSGTRAKEPEGKINKAAVSDHFRRSSARVPYEAATRLESQASDERREPGPTETKAVVIVNVLVQEDLTPKDPGKHPASRA